MAKACFYGFFYSKFDATRKTMHVTGLCREKLPDGMGLYGNCVLNKNQYVDFIKEKSTLVKEVPLAELKKTLKDAFQVFLQMDDADVFLYDYDSENLYYTKLSEPEMRVIE